MSGDKHISRLPGELCRFVVYLPYEEKLEPGIKVMVASGSATRECLLSTLNYKKCNCSVNSGDGVCLNARPSTGVTAE